MFEQKNCIGLAHHFNPLLSDYNMSFYADDILMQWKYLVSDFNISQENDEVTC